MPKLLFIPGSLRAASSSRATAEALMRRLEEVAACDLADPGRLPHYNADVTDDAAVAAFVAAIDQADGLVFVTPEYNYSIPGLLKNAIDWASRPAYASVFVGKPCAIVSTSGGALGGVRAQAHLKYVLSGMLAAVHPCRELVITHANARLSDGTLDSDETLGMAEDTLRAFTAALSRAA
ncbi:NAD(P)H-dependent oxidoreductase [Psychromarinibacter sp. C21-152]|uniref:NAD(P)H-dependent oxidoreductase n=1 Tax=Psychromarinibacter sediminicola TaxID=3033385 RepID=A0AAE3NNL7_9RHOB|nr:NADPH-dependent FMN reductase [Psychromarinibacter sediminicola]MDF0599614.1 NAD(P)H-dependent oxidoreductase [Psychromarinibacter sediminicola]